MLPTDYLESRRSFVALARAVGASHERFYQDDESDGPERLSTDVAYLGPDSAAELVIIASGTHGIEGYAGSACQLHFMADWSRFADCGLGFLLVHAVNPWGYMHDRRVTREGVDLNRNFVTFPVAAGTGAGYDAYHERLVLRYRPPPAGLWNELILMSGALSSARRRAIQEAITVGQYRHPDGLFYGGQEPTASRLAWETIVDRYTRGRRSVFLLDIHTGLGRWGEGELLSYLPPSSADFLRMSSWFQGELRSMAGGQSVSTAVEGTLTAAFDRQVAGQSYAVGLEFGTVPGLRVLNAMRADQWYHRHAERLSRAEREWARGKMKNAFAPSEVQWHGRVVARFEQVIQWVRHALAEMPAGDR